ncbi:MAG: hypothetical protein FJ149_00425 [Euryarchaeota archaeon]|nr:hypothetical protein [Euryarchaeota archaeon]
MEKTAGAKTGTVELFLELGKEGLRFLVTGGFAANLYGVERATYDIDLAISPEPAAITGLISALRRAGYTEVVNINSGKRIAVLKDIAPERIMEMESVRIRNRKEVDVLIVPSAQFEYLWEYRLEIDYAGTKIPLPNPMDLVHMKEQSSRRVDREDAKRLRHLIGSKKKQAGR